MLARLHTYVCICAYICMNSIHIFVHMCTHEYRHTGIHTHVCEVVSHIHGGYPEICVNFPKKSNMKRFPSYIHINCLATQMAGGCVHHRDHSRRTSQRKSGGVIHMHNPITWETEAGGWPVQGQPELHCVACKKERSG